MEQGLIHLIVVLGCGVLATVMEVTGTHKGVEM